VLKGSGDNEGKESFKLARTVAVRPFKRMVGRCFSKKIKRAGLKTRGRREAGEEEKGQMAGISVRLFRGIVPCNACPEKRRG